MVLVIGVVFFILENVKLVYKYKVVYGIFSEIFFRVINYLRCWFELVVLKYVIE